MGVALCSGGARGFANIGVLEELQKHGLKPDYIAGTSMGAIVGAAYCSGMPIEDIKEFAISCKWRDTLKFTLPKYGLIEGESIINYMRKEMKFGSFRRYQIPFRAIATNLDTGKGVVLESGDSAKAVYASIAIPGIFSPLKYKKMTLVDGGLVSPLPTMETRDMGADIVVGIDLSMHQEDISNKNSHLFGFSKDSEFMNNMKEKFKESQKELLKYYILDTRKSIPSFAKSTIERFIDRFYDPDKIIQKINRREQFEVFNILSKTVYIMTNQLIFEKVNNKHHDILVKPGLKGVGILNADHIEGIIAEGRKTTAKKIPQLKKLLQTA
ncbi:MAG: patatin-like phospholipase family protein [Candidatus Nanoarchaeia archaeon]